MKTLANLYDRAICMISGHKWIKQRIGFSTIQHRYCWRCGKRGGYPC